MANILMIEDQKLWQTTVSQLLRQGGHNVVVAGSYDDAHQCLTAHDELAVAFQMIVCNLFFERVGCGKRRQRVALVA